MKKIAYALMFLFVFCFFNFHSNAQSPCSAVSVEVIESSSQSGQFKNWGIRVFITQPYHDDITVEGTIEGGFAELWTLTIPAGNTSAQTSDNYYQTDPVTTAVATITNVSACPNGALSDYFDNKFSNIGTFHNQFLTNAHENFNPPNVNTYEEAINAIRDFNRNLYNNIEVQYFGSALPVVEVNNIFETYKYLVNFQQSVLAVLSSNNAMSIDSALYKFNSLPIDANNSHLLQNLSVLIKQNLNGSISYHDFNQELINFANQWLQINANNEESIGAKLTGNILAIGLKSLEWWQENPDAINQDNSTYLFNFFISFDTKRFSGPSASEVNLYFYLHPVVAADVAGAFIGTASSAIAQYSSSGSINMRGVYASAGLGALSFSVGAGAGLTRFLQKYF